MVLQLEAVDRSSSEWATLFALIQDPGGAATSTSVKLDPVVMWKVYSSEVRTRYDNTLSDVKLRTAAAANQQSSTVTIPIKTDARCRSLFPDLDAASNEKVLLTGVPPDRLAQILQEGLSPNFPSKTYSQGIYLFEDPIKLAQETYLDSRRASPKELELLLYSDQEIQKPGDVCYALVCRAALGCPVMAQHGVQAFEPGTTNQLVHPYTSLVAEDPPHRQFVVFRPSQLCVDYIVAYQCDGISFTAAATLPASGPGAKILGKPTAVTPVAATPKYVCPAWANPYVEGCLQLVQQVEASTLPWELRQPLMAKASQVADMLTAAIEVVDSGALMELESIVREALSAVAAARVPQVEQSVKKLQTFGGDLALLIGMRLVPPGADASEVLKTPVGNRRQQWVADRRERRERASAEAAKDTSCDNVSCFLCVCGCEAGGTKCWCCCYEWPCWCLKKKLILFDQRTSIRQQLIFGIGGGALIAVALFILVCCVVTYGLADNTKATVQTSLENLVMTDINTVSQEAAAAMDAQLRAVGYSISMTLATQASVLLSSGFSYDSLRRRSTLLLKQQPYYADFSLVPGCNTSAYPLGCPSDLGPLGSGASARLAGAATATGAPLTGSLTSPTIHAAYSGAAANDAVTWSNYLTVQPWLGVASQVLAVMSNDFATMYTQGPQTSLQMYLAVQINDPNLPGYSFRMTFPGYNLQDTTYDSTTRGWFSNAPEGSLYLQGPYVETVTKKKVVTLSSRSTVRSSGSQPKMTVVGAVVMQLSDLESITTAIKYYQSGFAVLCTVTGEVISWGEPNNQFTLYNSNTGTFAKLGDIDPNLQSLQESLASGGSSTWTYSYQRQSAGPGQGELWFVSAVPFFLSTPQGKSKAVNNLVVLMFARRSEILAPLPSLQVAVDQTTSQAVIAVIIGCSALFVAVVISIWMVDCVIKGPLKFLLTKSQEVIKAVSIDPEDGVGRYKDLAENMPKMDAQSRAGKRMSELGRLMIYFHGMVQRLGAAEQAHLEQPRYPQNPFFGMQNLIIEGKFQELKNRFVSPGQAPRKSPGEVEAERQQELLAAAVREEQKSLESSPSLFFVSCMGRFRSLRVLGGLSALLLLAGLVIIAIVVSSLVTSGSSSWLSATAVQIEAQVDSNLHLISYIKSIFTASYFSRGALDTLVVAQFMTQLYQGKFTYPGFESHPALPMSYSLDCICKQGTAQSGNYYALNCNAGIPSRGCGLLGYDTNRQSGYFSKNDVNCITSSGCFATSSSNTTRLTSLLDLKFRSTSFPGSQLAFIQVAQEDSYTRVYGYSYKDYANPSSCYPDADVSSIPSQYSYCIGQKQSCASGTFPVYDSRCRSWYQMAVKLGDPTKVAFQPPRMSSSGDQVVTSATPITSDGTSAGTLLGVFNMNLQASALTDSVNNLVILQSGYAFVVDSTAPTTVILHPLMGATACPSLLGGGLGLQCLESSFSSSEWSDFSNNILPQLTNPNGFKGMYKKGGQQWKIASSPLPSVIVSYTLVVTVPRSEVLAVVTKVNNAIASAVAAQGGVFGGIVAAVCILNALLLLLLLVSIDRAIKELIAACQHIAEGDLQNVHVPLPSSASSSDMRSLLEAFSQMLVAFRFGSDSYARGHMVRARDVFLDAADLFESVFNDRGAGSAYNNAAACHTALGEFSKASAGYTLGIATAQAQLNAAMNALETYNRTGKIDLEAGKSGDVVGKLQKSVRASKKQLSTRVGNYADLLIKSQDNQENPISILRFGQQIDEEIGSLYGWVVKQGLMSSYYLKKGEAEAAKNALALAVNRVESAKATPGFDQIEIMTSHMMAAFNLADFNLQMGEAAKTLPPTPLGQWFKSQGVNGEALAKNLLADSLCTTQVFDPRIASRVVRKLLEIFPEAKEKKALMEVANIFGVPVSSGGPSKKRVAFLVDYSGSMSGSRIRAAVTALRTVFNDFVKDNDEVYLAHFSNFCVLDFDLSKKSEGTANKLAKIDSLTQPNGGTAFFDAVSQAADRLVVAHRQDGSCGNWIVALTDGDDNASSMSNASLQAKFKSTKDINGLIIIAVGNGVVQAPLKELASSTEKGDLIFAESPDQISEAFSKAAEMIDGSAELEDL